MNNQYEIPVLEILKFESWDVVTISNGGEGGEGGGTGWEDGDLDI